MNRLKVKLLAGICLFSIEGMLLSFGQPAPASSLAAARSVAASPGVSPAPTEGRLGPRIKFAEREHDFGRAKSGEQVKYTYIFTNVGDATLEISGVHACGCITSDFTRKTEPGQTGMIPISFNSSAYGGPVTKSISVSCNDKSSPTAVLSFRGTVWKPIEVSPALVMFNNLNVESPPTTSIVKIVNNLDEPLTVSDVQSQNPAFSAELKPVTPGKEYQVLVTTVPPLPQGSVSGRITLKSSSPEMREIGITVYANNVQPTVTVTPAQVTLAGAPLPEEQTYSVNIVNKGAKPLALSQPDINAEGVDVQLKEMQPGQMYAAKLTFPKGFTVAQGQRVELRIKSSSSVIKVPVVQAVRAPGMIAPIHPAVSPTIAAPPPQASRQ